MPMDSLLVEYQPDGYIQAIFHAWRPVQALPEGNLVLREFHPTK